MKTRWYSSKYDSTEQKACLNSLTNHEKLLQKYTATMRLEWFFTGKLVITDAQWYDGIFFHTLSKNSDEFNAFIEFAKQGNIEVKRRNNYVMSMFAKPFYFGSIIDTELSETILQIGDKIQKEAKNLINASSYIEYLKSEISKNYSKLLSEFENFVITFEKLNFVSCNEPEIFSMFNNQQRFPDVMLSSRNILCDELNKIFKPENTIFSNAIKKSLRDYKNEIESNFPLTGYPNRSKIYSIIKETEKLCIHQEIRPFESFWEKFNKVYNSAIASQHDCNICQYNSSVNNNIYNKLHSKKNIINFPDNFTIALADISWGDFSEILLKNEKLLKYRENWLQKYNLAITKKDKFSIEEAYDFLPILVDEIINSFITLKFTIAKAHILQKDNFLIYSCSDNQILLDNYLVVFGNNYDNLKGQLITIGQNTDCDCFVNTIVATPKMMLESI